MNDLTRAHIEAEARLRSALESFINQTWRALPDYSDDGLAAFLRTAVPVVDAGKRTSINLTAAYLARYMGRAGYPVDAEQIAAKLRNGTPTDEVYRRPFVDVWTKLKNHTPWEDAVAAGGAYAANLAITDLQLAMRQTAIAIVPHEPSIRGWRRVPDGKACDLCLVASTQRYHRSDLMPIHNRCGCGVAPLLIGDGEGRIADEDLYRKISADGTYEKTLAADARSRIKKWSERLADPTISDKVRLNYQRYLANAQNTLESATRIGDAKRGVVVQVRKHGDMGPVLTNAAHEYALV